MVCVRAGFFFGEALGSLRRNWVITLAAVLTVFISMAILGLVLVINQNLNSGATSLKNRVEIEVFIKDNVPTSALQAKIKALPQLRSFQYISKAQALKDFEARLGTEGKAIVSNLGPNNPLPASYRIYVKDANQVDAVASRFFNDPAVDNSPGTHDGVRYAQATVRRMLGTINLVTKGMWIATVLFGVAGVLLISTTVRLSIFARRNEVEIMRLVGATNWFIRWPFMLEGFMTGLLGSVFAAIAIWVVNLTVFNWIKSSAINFLKVEMYPMWFKGGGWWPLGLLPTLVVMGAVLGSLGSYVALRRYLRV
jgi:cell division transport system permease protein